MGEQGHDKDHGLGRGAQPIEHRTCSGAEGFVALVSVDRCFFREWIPILPRLVWPLAGQCLLGQNVAAGSMIVLAVCGSMPRGV